MPKKVKVKLNRQGVRELMKSEEMRSIVNKYGFSAQSRLGNGYSVDYMTGKNRVNCRVFAKTAKAKRENFLNNTILKAVKG